MIKWEATPEEHELILKIVKRADKLGLISPSKLSLMMDLEATHCNGNPLDFKGLLGACELDFMHDIVGIKIFLDRKTGKLTDCFSPRYSKQEVTK